MTSETISQSIKMCETFLCTGNSSATCAISMSMKYRTSKMHRMFLTKISTKSVKMNDWHIATNIFLNEVLPWFPRRASDIFLFNTEICDLVLARSQWWTESTSATISSLLDSYQQALLYLRPGKSNVRNAESHTFPLSITIKTQHKEWLIDLFIYIMTLILRTCIHKIQYMYKLEWYSH